MQSCLDYHQVAGYKCLSDLSIYNSGIKHGFISNQLDLKNVDLCSLNTLPEIGLLALANQTHSSIVREVFDFGQEGDSFILKEGEVAGVRTADCVPLILISTKGRVGGAVIHAGWRGACGGIVQNTIMELENRGYKIEDFRALIGPSAQSCCYEVKSDVFSRFDYGVEVRGASTYLSVSSYLFEILLSLGMRRNYISQTKICTICSKDFFSYRRDGKLAGRFLSFLSL